MAARARRSHYSVLALLLAFLLAFFSVSPLGGETPRLAPGAPRLVVVVVIDQFRADYLVRFRDRFGPDGFSRLLRQGANFTSCFYPYANTETAPGHATLATGTTPSRHGITGNRWYDAHRGQVLEAVEDESSPIVGGTAYLPGVSPRNLEGTTLADELRLATGGEAKVFGVALKDRAAIFSTGPTASGAYWYDFETGRFITSRYYREALPLWVAAFNDRHLADRYYGRNWLIGGRVALEMTTASGKPDANFYNRLRYTPYGNELVVEFARELVKQEALGADAATDFLFVGFSANDYVGHRWGPYSEEVADMTVRTDKQLGELLKFLDRQVGAGNYWLILAADHGVAPTLEQARARGIRAKNIDSRALQAAVEKALTDRWGADTWLIPKAELTFNRETLNKHGVTLAEAAQVAGEAARTLDGVVGYVAAGEFHLSSDTAQAFRLSSYPGRTPDVVVVQEPFALFDSERGGTGHGTPYSYDTHVPLILYGAAFRPGNYREMVSPTDLAPTLAAALGINPPALADGKVLTQALRAPGPQSKPTPAVTPTNR